jgi:hypothetical protein
VTHRIGGDLPGTILGPSWDACRPGPNTAQRNRCIWDFQPTPVSRGSFVCFDVVERLTKISLAQAKSGPSLNKSGSRRSGLSREARSELSTRFLLRTRGLGISGKITHLSRLYYKHALRSREADLLCSGLGQSYTEFARSSSFSRTSAIH